MYYYLHMPALHQPPQRARIRPLFPDRPSPRSRLLLRLLRLPPGLSLRLLSSSLHTDGDPAQSYMCPPIQLAQITSLPRVLRRPTRKNQSTTYLLLNILSHLILRVSGASSTGQSRQAHRKTFSASSSETLSAKSTLLTGSGHRRQSG